MDLDKISSTSPRQPMAVLLREQERRDQERRDALIFIYRHSLDRDDFLMLAEAFGLDDLLTQGDTHAVG